MKLSYAEKISSRLSQHLFSSTQEIGKFSGKVQLSRTGTFTNATTFSSIDGGVAVRNNYAAVLSAAVLIAIGVPALVQADEQSHKEDKT